MEAAPNNEEEVCEGDDNEEDDANKYDDIVVNVSSTKINAVLKELAIIRKENPRDAIQ